MDAWFITCLIFGAIAVIAAYRFGAANPHVNDKSFHGTAAKTLAVSVLVTGVLLFMSSLTVISTKMEYNSYGPQKVFAEYNSYGESWDSEDAHVV